MPYIKSKLDEFYEIQAGGAIRYISTQPTRPPTDSSTREKLTFYGKRYYRLVYPYVNMGWYLSILLWHVRYLFGATEYYNPLLQIIGVKLRRVGSHDAVLFFSELWLT